MLSKDSVSPYHLVKAHDNTRHSEVANHSTVHRLICYHPICTLTMHNFLCDTNASTDLGKRNVFISVLNKAFLCHHELTVQSAWQFIKSVGEFKTRRQDTTLLHTDVCIFRWICEKISLQC